MQELNILGSTWTMVAKDVKEDEYLSENYGYCDESVRKIVAAKAESIKVDPGTPEDLGEMIKKTKRHEIIHAYLFEAGLGFSSGGIDHWAVNEEMVDWFARQWPKIQATFKAAGCEA